MCNSMAEPKAQAPANSAYSKAKMASTPLQINAKLPDLQLQSLVTTLLSMSSLGFGVSV